MSIRVVLSFFVNKPYLFSLLPDLAHLQDNSKLLSHIQIIIYEVNYNSNDLGWHS